MHVIYNTNDYENFKKALAYPNMMMDKMLVDCFVEVPIDRSRVDEIINDIEPEPASQPAPAPTIYKATHVKEINYKKATSATPSKSKKSSAK